MVLISTLQWHTLTHGNIAKEIRLVLVMDEARTPDKTSSRRGVRSRTFREEPTYCTAHLGKS